MLVSELLDRIDSRELTGWWALYQVRGEEAEYTRHLAESGDGVVVVTGQDDIDDEE